MNDKFNDYSKSKKYEPRYGGTAEEFDKIKLYDSSNNEAKLLQKYQLSYEARFKKQQNPKSERRSSTRANQLERGLKDTVLSKYQKYETREKSDKQNFKPKQYAQSAGSTAKEQPKEKEKDRLTSILERYQKNNLKTESKYEHSKYQSQKYEAKLQRTSNPGQKVQQKDKKPARLSEEMSLEEKRAPMPIPMPRQFIRSIENERSSCDGRGEKKPKDHERELKKQEIMRKIKELNNRLKFSKEVQHEEGEPEEGRLRRELEEKDRQIEELNSRVAQQEYQLRELAARLRDKDREVSSLNAAVQQFRDLFDQLSRQ